jgi:hypothetical protein
MDPGTMAAVGMGSTIAGGAVKAIGDLFGGAAQGKMFEYQAGVAQARARIDEQNARWAERAGEENALYSGMRTRFAVGGIRAGQGASNIDVNRGSSVAVRAGQTEVGQMNEAQIRTNAARKAFGFRVEEATDAAQAGMYSSASATARTASYYDAGASILGAAGTVASKWAEASASFGSGSGAPDYLYQNPNTPEHAWDVTGLG